MEVNERKNNGDSIVLISILVVSVDYSMQPFNVKFQMPGDNAPTDGLAPVFRIFGSTDNGQRVAVNLHGAFPYFYIRPESLTVSSFDSIEKVKSYLPAMQKSLDDLIHSRLEISNAEKGFMIKRKRHIHKLEAVAKKTIYGMYLEEFIFVKVYVKDPRDVLKLTEILEQGGLNGIVMQTYESHIPYHLQFTSDYNISPMGWLKLNNAKFRLPLPSEISSFPPPTIPSIPHMVSSNPSEDLAHITHAATYNPSQLPTHSSLEHPPLYITPPGHVDASADQLNNIFTTTPHIMGYMKQNETNKIKSNLTSSQHSKASSSYLSIPRLSSSPSYSESRRFTQTTIPKHLLWDPSIPTHEANGEHHPDEEHDKNLEPSSIEQILEGITREDLISSQYPINSNASSKDPIPPPLIPKKYIPPLPNMTTTSMDKKSSCELEIDTHVSNILNIQSKRLDFGSELWEEEKIRREMKHLEPYQVFTPVKACIETSSDTYLDRVPETNECEFFHRFENLLKKASYLHEMDEQMNQVDYNGGGLMKEENQLVGLQDFKTDAEVDQDDKSSQKRIKRKSTNEIFRQLIELPSTSMHSPSEKNESALGAVNGTLSQIRNDSPKFAASDPVQLRWMDSQVERAKMLMTQDQHMEWALTFSPMNSARSSISQVQDGKEKPLGVVEVNHEVVEEMEQQSQDQIDQELLDISGSTQANPPNLPEKTYIPTVSEDSTLFRQPLETTYDIDTWTDFNTRVVEHNTTTSSTTKPPLHPKVKAISFSNAIDPAVSTPPSNAQTIHEDKPPSNTLELNSVKEKIFTPEVKSNEAIFRIEPRMNDQKSGLKLSTAFRKRKLSSNTVPGDSHVRFATATDSKVINTDQLVSSKHSMNDSSPLTVDGGEESRITNEDDNHNAVHTDIPKLGIHQNNQVMVIFPSFYPPKSSSLSSLSVFGLDENVNRTVHWSEKSDLALKINSITSSTSTTSKGINTAAQLAVQRHPIHYLHDLADFDGGFPGTRRVPYFGKLMSEFRQGSLPCQKQSRYLLPTFMPPPPERLWRESVGATSNHLGTSEGCHDDGSAIKNNHSQRKAMYSKSNSNAGKVKKPKVKEKILNSITKKSKQQLKKSQICTPTQTQKLNPNSRSGQSSTDNANTKQNIGIIAKSSIEKTCRLTILSVEVFCFTRAQKLPNPRFDEVEMICWVVEDTISNSETELSQRLHGVIVQSRRDGQNKKVTHNEKDTTTVPDTRNYQMKASLVSPHLPLNTQYQVVDSEPSLFQEFIMLVERIDPDFLTGYEIQNSSFGYLIKRGKVINIELLKLLSKMPEEKEPLRNSFEDMLESNDVEITITGRIFINMWQRMRSEVKLMNYTYNNVAAHVLKIRVPQFSSQQLSRWYEDKSKRWKTVQHMYLLTELNILLLNKCDLIRRTAESARLYGIDFNSVLTRGSQYRVEASLMIKAHAYGYILISPSRVKVARQAAMEVIPLVMEPNSSIYTDPVLVLDFQSLYPSMIVAYNLCFSTCFGKLNIGKDSDVDTTERLGSIEYPELQTVQCVGSQNVPLPLNQQWLSHYNHDTPYLSPNGSLFCSKNTRLGLLPQMCKEMLETRVMIKKSMKLHSVNMDTSKSSNILHKVLEARQLAIKMLSNVTYGYTAAGFSGRMPMAELADAIVQSGRSTLEWTVKFINSHPTWRAVVKYGDTDSVFVLLKGRSLVQAFTLGNEIANEITKRCPVDVLLKFEKVFYPCVLVTKKRYVGFAYETVDQKIPHFDAKGVEAIRRDQCPATMKIQEKSLRILFETRNMSLVKEYLHDQWMKMLEGGDKLTIRDFIFCKEVRYGTYASISSQPPGAIIIMKALLLDEMAVPPHNWRVPYVVVHGVPNSPLKNLIFTPQEILRRGSSLRINYIYYINKCINPALDRVLSLCGADINTWFNEISRPKPRIRHMNYDQDMDGLINPAEVVTGLIHFKPQIHNWNMKQTSMDQFTTQKSCQLCGEKDAVPCKSLCVDCGNNPMEANIMMSNRWRLLHQRSNELTLICSNCAKTSQHADLFVKGEMIGTNCCESLDCMVFFERCRIVSRTEDILVAISEL